MDDQKEQQKEQEIEAIKELLLIDKAKHDIQFFAERYLSHHLLYKMPEFHGEIYKLLETQRLAIAAPRSFAKSTIVQLIYGLWLLLTKAGRDILTISQSGTLAEEWVRKIKLELETNELIINDFDWLTWGKDKSKKWTESHITIDDGHGKIVNQIRARGRGCQIRGFRPTEIICDDLEDDEEVRSSEQREKLKHWFLAALLNTIDMRQQLIIIGTILHPLAILNDIIERKEEFKSWVTKKYRALTDGKSIWEDKWPTQDLIRKRMEIGTYAFQSEYQNDPMASDVQLIKQEWIKKWDTLPKTTNFLIIDPAISTKDSADETAMVVLGLGEDHKIYEVDSISGRWGIWDIYKNLKTLFLTHNPIKIGVESIAYQQVLKPILTEKGREEGIYFPIQSITLGTYNIGQKQRKESKDKFSRALGITHLFEQGLVYLKHRKLIDQCLLFPTGDLDDLFDALVYGLHMIMKYARESNIFIDKSERRAPSIGVKSFEIKDNTIPALVPESEFMNKGDDWRIKG